VRKGNHGRRGAVRRGRPGARRLFHKSKDSGTGTGPSATGLRQALSSVTATDDTRAWEGYDAIAELTKVVGKRSGRGFGLLLLQGTDLFKEALNAPADTGIAPLDADDRTILLSWQCASATGT
jgi:hypothetical protein